MELTNSTSLRTAILHELFLRHTLPYLHDKLVVRVRYTRSTDFSGTCYYREGRIYVNVGRHLTFPYRMYTNVARPKSGSTHWSREAYTLQFRNSTQLALFIYLHELYHYLVHAARRNPRQKEGMCDRFAARVLVDHFGCVMRDARGRPVARESWDFQDLDGFVAKAAKVPHYATPPCATAIRRGGGSLVAPTEGPDDFASLGPLFARAQGAAMRREIPVRILGVDA
ncbi:MAG: hypothetical protein AB7N71_13540 [Phycisphaerae bacterium]